MRYLLDSLPAKVQSSEESIATSEVIMLPANRVTTTFLIQRRILELCSSQNSKSEALNTKQITEKGFCCSFLGMAARMVLRRRCMAKNRTINNKQMTIRVAMPYNHQREAYIIVGFRILRLGFLKRIYILYD